MIPVATTTERSARLDALERIMQAHEDGFYSFVQAYTAIRDEELYKEAGHASFTDYLQQRWGRAYSYRLLHSADAMAQLSTFVDEGELRVIQKPAQAHALAHVKPALQPAVVELLNSTIVDKPTASKIGKLGKVLEGVLEELQRTGTISVTEEDQLPAAAIPAITSAVLLELKEANYRQLQHLTDLQQKRLPFLEYTGRANDPGLINWPAIAADLGLSDEHVTVRFFEGRKGCTIRVERSEA